MYAIRSYYAVFHTIGFPEPEIFGFFYVHPDRIASVGIFVPSWFDNPVRTTYRYLRITSYNVCYTKLLRFFERLFRYLSFYDPGDRSG